MNATAVSTWAVYERVEAGDVQRFGLHHSGCLLEGAPPPVQLQGESGVVTEAGTYNVVGCGQRRGSMA